MSKLFKFSAWYFSILVFLVGSGRSLWAGEPPIGATVLWNGHDVANWRIFSTDPANAGKPVWSAGEGVLRLASPASGYLRTVDSYSDYHLHFEWRWPAEAPPRPNSGVIIHLNGPDRIWPDGYEFQMREGIVGQVVAFQQELPGAPTTGGLQRAAALARSSESPRGEWNTAEITCRADTVEIVVNGVLQNRLAGLPVTSGAIALQLEGAPIEFRHVWLRPLPAQP